MHFAKLLRVARLQSKLTQADVAALTGIARPNIAAYESDSREPRISTANKLLSAVGATLTVHAPITWTWTTTRRPYAIPSRTWRLPPKQALATIQAEAHIWWSGPPRVFDLSVREQRLRAYEIILREGTPLDIEAVIDEMLLNEAWNDLVLPSELRRAWQPLIDTHNEHTLTETAA